MKIFIPAIIIVIIDQLSKNWIKVNYILYESRNIIGDFIRFTFVENPGIAFGIDIGDLKVVVAIISFIIILYICQLLYNFKSLSKIEAISLSFILGGAIGNFIDRVLVYIPNSGYNGVVDFIDIGYLTHRWYIFNIADSAVTIGMILYFVDSIFKSNNLNKNNV
mgnify:CR=1 FL=1